MEYVSLNNGVKMPMEGIGTFLLTPDEAETAVLSALKDGARLSGMGQRAAGAAPRRCSQHYARCQALARRCAGQLVFPSGGGSTWRKLPQSVV